MRGLLLAGRSLFFASCFVWLWAWVALSVRAFDRRWDVGLPAWSHAAGIPLLIAGGGLAIACILTFLWIGRGTPAPFDPPREFVAAGPYRLLRNPMYVGGWLMLVGFALQQRSLSMLGFSLCWLTVVHLLVVTLEEPGLRRRFGASYEVYCKRVPRWIPGRRRPPG